MKRKEILVKSRLYTMILVIADEKKDLVKLIKDLYESLKDVPVNELQKEFMYGLAEIIHSESEKQRELAKETV